VGGFDISIGRIGHKTLLSGEETVVQDRLRDRGYKVRYTPHAKVRHHVDPSRLTRNWMRSRMAWQGVSELLQDPQAHNLEGTLLETLRVARELGLESALERLFAPLEGEKLANQLLLFRHLVVLMLSAKDFESEALRSPAEE
jgi:hypothetical protein